MKKFLLSALLLLGVSVSYSQTTIETAQELNLSGENSYTDESGTGSATAYWKYTATENTALSVTPVDCTISAYELVTDEVSGDTKQVELKGCSIYDNATYTSTYTYPVVAGHTVYLKCMGGSTVGVTYKGAEVNEAIGKGMTEDTPFPLALDSKYFLGTAYDASYSGYYFYATLTPTESGIIALEMSSYTEVYVNSSTTSETNKYNNSTGIYTTNISVEAGNTYSLAVKTYNPLWLTAKKSEVKAGSLDVPFTITEGADNVIPAAAGTYYYKYTSEKTGSCSLSSTETLTGIQAKLFTATYNIPSNPILKSAENSVDMKFDINYSGSTYYVEITKAADSESEQHFTMAIEDFGAGIDENNPIVLTLPSVDVECPSVTSPTYFVVEIPAQTPTKYLSVTGKNVTYQYTSVYIYEEGLSPNSGSYGYGSVKATVSNDSESAKRYMIKWSPSNESAAIKFDVALEDIPAGDSESNPKLIEIPSSDVVCNSVSQPTYFAVDIPANTPSSYLVIEGTNCSSDYTRVSFYEEGTQSYYGQSGYKTLMATVENTGSTTKRYIIKWEPYYNETEAIKFNVYYKEVEKGDVITNPLTAVAGDNTLPSSGTKYYVYTATIAGKLVVTSPAPETTFTFPRGAGQYDGTYIPTVSGVKYTIDDITAGTQYYITVNNGYAGDIFTVKEMTYGPGESRATALDVENSEYELASDKIVSNLWLKYTTKSDCILTIESDLPYNSSDAITYASENDAYMSSMITNNADYSTSYKVTLAAKSGTVYYVNVKCTSIHEGNKVIFTEREPNVGEAVNNPLILIKDETRSIPVSSRLLPTWAKVYVKPGVMSIKSSAYIENTLYKSLESAIAESGETIYLEYQYDNETSSSYYYKEITVSEDEAEGWRYIKLSSNYAAIDYTISGDAVVLQGDVEGWPLEAVAGENTIATNGTKYYTYTTTLEGRLSVTTSSDETATLYDESGVMESVTEGSTTTADITAGKTIIIKVEGAKAGSLFTVAESEYAQGELRSNPIIVENGEYTYSGELKSVWLQYTVAKAGFLTIEWNAEVTEGNIAAYGLSSDENLQPLVSTIAEKTRYCVENEVSAGEVYLVNIISTADAAGSKITFKETENGIVGISTAANKSQMTIDGNNITVSGSNSPVEIYSITGTRVAKRTVSGSASFSLPAGIYVVNIDGKAAKTQVK